MEVPQGAAFTLAADLVATECEGEEAPTQTVDSCHLVLKRLYALLRPTLGTGGYELLLGRAVIKVVASYPSLGGLEVPSQGPPTRAALRSNFQAMAPIEQERAARALLGEFLDFMARLLGWKLVLILLSQTWPRIVQEHETKILGRPSDASPIEEES